MRCASVCSFFLRLPFYFCLGLEREGFGFAGCSDFSGGEVLLTRVFLLRGFSLDV